MRLTVTMAETLLTFLVIGLVLPMYRTLAESQGDRRYEDSVAYVRGLPDSVLASTCQAYAAAAEQPVRERLCKDIEAQQLPVESAAALPTALADAVSRTQQAFLGHLSAANERLANLRLEQREGVGDLRALGEEIAALQGQLEPFVKRFDIDAAAGGPLSLACSVRLIEASAIRQQRAPFDAAARMAHSNAYIVLAASLDGHHAAAAIASSVSLPQSHAASFRECVRDDGLSSAIGRTVAHLAAARTALANAAKNDAMRVLLTTAGWQWAAWMLIGLLLLHVSRRFESPALGVALALATWALVAWLCRIPWPLAGERIFAPARSETLFSAPAAFVYSLLAAAVLIAVMSRLRRGRSGLSQAPASRIGYAGFALVTGIGWLLLLDLSANGHLRNRYLALYHQGHLWLAMLVLSVTVFLRQPLGRALAFVLSLVDEYFRAFRQRWPTGAGISILIAAALTILSVGIFLSGKPQRTSELGRLWLIAGVAWFFFLRGRSLAQHVARTGRSLVSLAKYLRPLVLVAGVLAGTMLITHDMGPLLIACYGTGAFIAASIVMWQQERKGAVGSVAGPATSIFFALWIGFVTALLFQGGAVVPGTTADRLEGVAAPLSSRNDQLALITWFRRATPAGGFGLGAAPWCGYSPAAVACSGVPAQTPQDYTFSALVGVFGFATALAFALIVAAWLHRLIWHHPLVTRGEPRLVRIRQGFASDDQAYLSWLCVTWVVLTLCQLVVTVAGNLRVLPLTGVTFPFVSYGLTSLIVNTAFLGLCLNLTLIKANAHVEGSA